MDLQHIIPMSKLTNYCIFTGCSYTYGSGLDSEVLDSGLWCNIMHTQHGALKELTLVNLGKPGNNNQEIFQSTVEGLLSYEPKYMFVCWSEHLRQRLNPGVETYETSIFVSANSDVGGDVNLNNVSYSVEYIKNVKNRYFDLQHLHYKFLEVLDYCRILNKLANKTKTKIYFINGICEWDDLYFDHIQNANRMPADLTPVTQNLINIESRDDDEIFKIYDKMHTSYKGADGLCNWLNLYRSYRGGFYLDLGNDNIHPGYISNKKFAEFLMTKF